MDLNESEFLNLQEKIREHGQFHIDIPNDSIRPKAVKGWNFKKTRFGYLYVKYGGDHKRAAKDAGYFTMRNTHFLERFWSDPPMRSYIQELFVAFGSAEKATGALPAIGNAALAASIAAYQPGKTLDLPALPIDVASKEEVLSFLTAAIRAGRPGLYYLPDGRVNLEAVMAAPPGVIKSIERTTEDYKLTFYDIHASANSLRLHYEAKADREKQKTEDGRMNVRTLVVNLLKADPENITRLDEMSKQAGQKLKALPDGRSDAPLIDLKAIKEQIAV